MSKIKTRFAPSPTGYLHVGGVRTALFAWLIAKQSGGEFVLRIEDTDRNRHVEGAAEHIIECLEWLGLNYDEGPIYQSDRVKNGVYKKWADKLIQAGRAYADPYSQEEVQTFREQAQRDKKPFLYRNHRPEDPLTWDGKNPLRFKSDPKSYRWNDEVMGGSTNHKDAIDDFILIKSDGYPTYNFAHIVDDIDMGISHIIRGQEFLSSIPNYLNLYEALGEEPPIFATVPHILNEQGNKKLSKRDGAKDLLDFKKQGYLPEAMINFLASLGWNDGTEQEIFKLDELIKKFSLERINRSGAHFDERRLNWINGHFIREKNTDELYKLAESYWPETASDAESDYKKKVLNIVQERLKFLAELPEMTSFFFEEPRPNPELIKTHKKLKKVQDEFLKYWLETTIKEIDAIKSDEWTADNIQVVLNNLLEKTSTKPHTLFSLIRIALTQSPASPALNETIEVLGKAETIKRLTKQIEQF